ncbi:MAG: T9SS type A sorting domain-containing protein, partial [Bacteroidetes bacterium]|nr:T9SS type A sorting domain-containing protein [Fibrella sp.]
SNVYHLSRYMLGLMRSELVSPATSNTMWTAQTLNNGTATGFGLGLKVDQSSGDLGVWHDGVITDHSHALMDFFPNQQLGIVLMTNDGRVDNIAMPILIKLKQDLLDQVRCPESRTFVGTGIWGRDLTYEAADFIEAYAFQIGDSKVVFDAGNTIRLKPGFRALEGTQFKAIIDGCGGTTTPAMARKSFEAGVESGNQPVPPKKAASFAERSSTEQPLHLMPNPFRDVVKMAYTVKQTSTVNLVLYNVQGNEVGRPVNNELKSAGAYQVEFDGRALPDGMYLYRLQIGTETVNGKLIKTQ